MAKIRVLILILAVFGGTGVWAKEEAAGATDAQPVALQVGRSILVDAGTPITRISLTSSDIADALVTGPNQILIHGKVPGSISMFVWNKEGAVQRYEVAVQRDLTKLRTDMQQIFPSEPIDAQQRSLRRAVGIVSNKDVSERATNLAVGFVEKRDEVVTMQVNPNPRVDQYRSRSASPR
jgi:Flp pilus assembly secretin CpaC